MSQRLPGASADPAVRKWSPAGAPAPAAAAQAEPPPGSGVAEVGGRADGTEPTRYGDWEKQGRCIDF